MKFPPIMSRELQDAIEDGGDAALQLVLNLAVARNDLKMIAYVTRVLNARRAEAQEMSQ